MRKTKKCLAAGIYPKKVARCILENCTELGQPVLPKTSSHGARRLSEFFLSVIGSLVNVQFHGQGLKEVRRCGQPGVLLTLRTKSRATRRLHKTCFPCHVPAKDRDYVFACSVGNYPETGFEEASRIGTEKSASRTRNHCGTAGRHPCQSEPREADNPHTG